MAVICKNCETNFNGRYCNNCGQPAATYRINSRFLSKDIQHTFFHFEKKFWRTLKELILEPGVLIRNYLDGKRERYYKPISSVIVLASFYGFLFHFLDLHFFVKLATNESKDTIKIDYNQINEWYIVHFSWLTLLMIPLYALANKICFSKQQYNYIEHIVASCYVSSQLLLVRFFFLPFAYYFSSDSEKTLTIYKGLNLVTLMLVVWTYFQIFDKIKPLKRILLSFLSYFIFVLLVFLILLLVFFYKP